MGFVATIIGQTILCGHIINKENNKDCKKIILRREIHKLTLAKPVVNKRTQTKDYRHTRKAWQKKARCYWLPLHQSIEPFATAIGYCEGHC